MVERIRPIQPIPRGPEKDPRQRPQPEQEPVPPAPETVPAPEKQPIPEGQPGHKIDKEV